jgi:hypothetical protein
MKLGTRLWIASFASVQSIRWYFAVRPSRRDVQSALQVVIVKMI